MKSHIIHEILPSHLTSLIVDQDSAHVRNLSCKTLKHSTGPWHTQNIRDIEVGKTCVLSLNLFVPKHTDKKKRIMCQNLIFNENGGEERGITKYITNLQKKNENRSTHFPF